MSIEKLEMYTVICDNCKVSADEGTDYSCWNDKDYAQENAIEGGFIKEDENHYCPKCYSYDENDTIIINQSRFNPK